MPIDCYVCQVITRTQRGQSLVETALVTPILIFLLLGLFEAGYALRSYIVLTNASREAARFAIRHNYIHPEQTDPGFDAVYRHTLEAVTQQLDGFEDNSTVIIQYVEIGVTYPCDPEALDDCDCALAATLPFTAATWLDRPKYLASFPPGRTSAIDAVAIAARLGPENNRFNCELMKRRGNPSANSLVVVEIFYRHRQLFGVPLISNPYTDPIQMYGHTAMRHIQAARSTGQEKDLP